MKQSNHEYTFEKHARLAAQDQRENMGRKCKVVYTGRGFKLVFDSRPKDRRE